MAIQLMMKMMKMITNTLTREQVQRLQLLIVNAIPEKQSRIINDACDCRIYLYNKETDVQPTCAKSWFEFCFMELAPRIAKNTEQLTLILSTWIKMKEHQSLHLIDYLSDCFDKINGEKNTNSEKSVAKLVRKIS